MQAVAKEPAAKIVAVADVSKKAAQAAAQDFAAQAFASHKAMLKSCKLDAVYVSVPPFAHGGPEFDLLERGLPFFVEKPVALDLETALHIAQRVRDTEALTCVGYQLRYTNAALGTRAFLADKTIGLALGRYHCGTGRGTGWLREFAQSGGQIVEQATHTIDMMRFLCGEIAEVYSLQANRTLSETDCPDHGVTALKFADGALGALTTVWALDPSVWDANVVDVFFDRYRLSWNPSAPSIAPALPAFQLPTEPRKSIDQVFLDAVRTGDRSEILTPYDDAIRSLAVSLAANTSVRTGVPQAVPTC